MEKIYPKMSDVKVTPLNEEETIGKTELSIERFEKEYQKTIPNFKYKRVDFPLCFLDNEHNFYYNPNLIEIAIKEGFQTYQNMTYYMPNMEGLLYITWRGLEGGMVVAPRII